MRALFAFAFPALVACILAACDRAPVLRMDGFGAARVGMTMAEVEAALGPLVVPGGVDPQSCFYVRADKYPGVFAMMMDGVLQRIDVRSDDTATDTGVRVGDRAEKVGEIYGADVEVLPHKYEYASGAQYLTILSGDKRHALRFNTSSGKIASFQAGNAEPVQFVEGCG